MEEVTGKRFQDVVAEEILRPARMDRSGFFAMNQLPECTALGYIEDGESWRTNIYNLPIVGASDGGLFSTLADITALWDGFWNGEIVSEELVRTFSAPFSGASDGDSGLYYGHGMWIRRRADGTLQHYIMGADAGISLQVCRRLSAAVGLRGYFEHFRGRVADCKGDRRRSRKRGWGL